jgi:hypothetical protein
VTVLTFWLLASLIAFAGAHVALLVGLGRARVDGWRQRLVLATLLPPLAAWYGWEAGLRRPAWTWLGALAAYAVGATIAGR